VVGVVLIEDGFGDDIWSELVIELLEGEDWLDCLVPDLLEVFFLVEELWVEFDIYGGFYLGEGCVGGWLFNSIPKVLEDLVVLLGDLTYYCFY
jgi:hypothetical protein